METTINPKEGRIARYLPILTWLPQYQKAWLVALETQLHALATEIGNAQQE